MSTIVVTAASLQGIMVAALKRRGTADEHIDWVVRGLLQASLRGIDTHGVRLFPTYLRELDGGRSRVRPALAVESTGRASAVLDADHALGLVAGMAASREVSRLARAGGIGAVAVRNSNHFGAASYYTLEIARHDLIGISFSNSDALVTPYNGRLPLFGTNPLSLAAPGEGEDVFCVDMATSQVSYSKVRRCWEASAPLSPGWALDEAGEDAAGSGRQPVALAPLGGYKGQCLAMMVEVLCALLAGTPLAYELTSFYNEPFDEPRRIGHFFIAIDIAAFQDPAVFKRRLSGLLDYTRAQEPADGQPVCSPGDIARGFERERAAGGIPLGCWEREEFERLAAEECLPLQTPQPMAKA